ncbi:MAG: sulfite exporter TauE/SafE family protein [Elusimicrobiota bacterium]
MPQIVLFPLIGLFAGLMQGFFGVGGAVLIIPGLVYLGKFTQMQAQGTSLATFLLPIGIFFAVLNYHRTGNVNIKAALLMTLGMVAGAYFGSLVVRHVPDVILKRLFGILLAIIAVNMIISAK